MASEMVFNAHKTFLRIDCGKIEFCKKKTIKREIKPFEYFEKVAETTWYNLKDPS